MVLGADEGTVGLSSLGALGPVESPVDRVLGATAELLVLRDLVYRSLSAS
jgi:hypothetical protein